MTAQRPIPPDMLLIAERKRKMASPQSSKLLDSDEILTTDEDQLVEAPAAAESMPAHGTQGDLLLRRPVEYVSLVQLGWSGPIDHHVLQAALRCYPAQSGTALPQMFDAAPFEASGRMSAPALEVTLRAGDITVAQALSAQQRSTSFDRRAEAGRLILAVSLPDRIAGADADAVQAVSPVLAAYRRASLEHAWHAYLSGTHSPQLHRERDEAAVALLSTLRALLGER